MSRRSPRSLAVSLQRLRDDLAPPGVLARTQSVWEQAVGPTIAAHACPAAEREGRLTVDCSASVWAAELAMMAPRVLESLNAALGGAPDGGPLRELRCRTR